MAAAQASVARRRCLGAAADDGLRRTADAGGDRPADVVGEVHDDLTELLDGQLAALEGVVELDVQEVGLVLRRQDADRHEATVSQRRGVVVHTVPNRWSTVMSV